MSRIHRALEKADREGLLTWTQGQANTAAALPEPEAPPPALLSPAPARPRTQRTPPWEMPADDPFSTVPGAAEREVRLSPTFVAGTAPASSAAEHYRLLHARIERQEHGRRRQLIVVTSACIGDGKTTTSANLALTMAQQYGQRVVLVEGDLRRPTLAQQFGLGDGVGLVDVLVGGTSLDVALTHLPAFGLHILPGGLPTPRSTGMVASQAFRRVIDALRGRFDRIILDAPPSSIADTHELARIADGLLFVVRSGVTPRASFEKALEELESEKLLGVVLNDSVSTREHGGYTYADAPRDAARG